MRLGLRHAVQIEPRVDRIAAARETLLGTAAKRRKRRFGRCAMLREVWWLPSS
jgi:hypothetical protein